MKKTWFAWAAAFAVALSLAAPAAALTPGAAGERTDVEQEKEAPGMERSELYYGQVAAITLGEDGLPARLRLSAGRGGEYVMILSQDTVWVDGGRKCAFDPAELKEGDGVYVFHSPASTRSLPPQSAAWAVVCNVPQDAGCGWYYKVGSLTWEGDGRVRILTSDGSMRLTAGEDTVLCPYGEGTFSLSQLKEEDRFMAWYDVAALSYPGQAYVHHLMLLPAGDRQDGQPSGGQALAGGTQITMELDGRASNLVGRYEQGTVMVPVAAVAQALGLEVTYTPGAGGAAPQVTVESGQFQVKLTIGSPLLWGVTKIPGAVGMTAPQDCGKAPYVVSPGITWAPAQLFEMLGKTVTLEGTNLIIR